MTEAAPATAPEGQAAGQGNPAPWYKADGFAPEVQGYIENKGWQESPLKAITAYQSLEKFQGVPAEQLIKLPKDMSDAEAMGQVYARLGRPEKPDGYKFTPPEGVEIDEGRLGWFGNLAHKLNMNPAQHNAMVSAAIEHERQYTEEATAQIQAEQTAQMNEVKKEWGDKFEERSELARRAVKLALPAGLDDEGKTQALSAIENAIGTANFLKMFANLGEKIGEDKIHQSDSTQKFGYSPEQAKADKAALMTELQGDKERLKVYNTGKGADYEKMQRLNKVAFG